MFGSSRFTYLIFFLALLGPALSATYYRVDDRTPARVHEEGGLWSWNPQGTGSIVDHVYNRLGQEDPWVSTTSDKNFAKASAKSAGIVYIYKINPRGLDLVDTMEDFANQNEEHPHPGEMEFSVKGFIPWENIRGWDVYRRGKKIDSMTRQEFERQLETCG